MLLILEHPLSPSVRTSFMAVIFKADADASEVRRELKRCKNDISLRPPWQLMPSQLAAQLQGLVPFLEASPAGQDYLVHRLRELARGGAMSAYR